MLRGLIESFSSLPRTGVEITSGGVCGVSVGRGKTPRVTGVAWEPVPPGAVRPMATDLNVADRDGLGRALARVLERLGSPRRVALVLPDAAGKVSMLTLEDVPKRRAEVEQVVRWQIRKAIPFPVDAAQVAWTETHAAGDNGHRLVVAVMRRDIVEEYESVCSDAGAQAGVVDLSTFDLVNATLAGQAQNRVGGPPLEDGWLLVHVAPESTSLAIVRAGRLVFYRSRQGTSEDDVVDAVHQSAMYYEDRLGGHGFGRILAHVSTHVPAPDALWSAVESRLGVTVEAVDPRLAADFGDAAGDHQQVAAATAPLGVVLRG